jgi:uncharacterized protein with FMN-binding domain
MRRAILALTGVVAGTTLLISVKSAPGASRLPAQVIADQRAAAKALAAASAPAVTSPPTPVSTVPGTGVRPTVKPSASAHQTATSTTAPPVVPKPATTSKPPTVPNAPGPITGDSAFTEFGYVTVAITVANGRITDVTAVEMPGDESRSRSLSAAAAPELRRRALVAQSSHIDTYSGATWTSDAYRASLQSAITKAGLA